jgi:hypothetical protein
MVHISPFVRHGFTTAPRIDIYPHFLEDTCRVGSTVKIVREEQLIHCGTFAESAAWGRAHKKLHAAIKAVEWPPNSGKFTIYAEAGRNAVRATVCRREMKPIVGDRWHGWHGFRRGLATVLYGLGVPAEVAQTILRQEDVSTTRAHHLMLKSRKDSSAAMKRLGRVVRQANRAKSQEAA